MCSKIRNPANFAASDWIEGLLEEHDNEEKMEDRWPTLLLHSSGRNLVWNMCDLFGVSTKGVPASACRLLERYLCKHIRTFLQVTRDNDEWERYKIMLASRFNLLVVSCIQLAAKMSDLQAPMSATTVRNTFLKEGIVHSKAEIVEMEFHVYSTLDFLIPLWTSLEVAEFLANQVGLEDTSMIEAVGLIMNLTEYNKDQLQFHMRCRSETCAAPGSSISGANRGRLHNLHVCAGAVSAAVRYMRGSQSDLTDKLATLIRSNFSYIKAISDTILNHIIPEKKYIPILKKRRLR